MEKREKWRWSNGGRMMKGNEGKTGWKSRGRNEMHRGQCKAKMCALHYKMVRPF